MLEIEISLVLLVVCILFSAFFSGTEAAFLATRRYRLRHLAESGSASAAIAERMLERPERFLSTVLVGNNLVNTAAAALATAITTALLDADGAAVLIATLATTALLLLFGEITPKTIAARHAERSMVIVARPFRLLSLVLTPIAMAFAWFASSVARLSGGARRAVVSVEELRTLVTTGVEEGTVEEQEAELVKKVFRFGDRMVREVMTPRTEIAWVQAGTTFKEFLEVYAEHSHSHFPIYGEGTDEVIGVLSIKDVLRSLSSNSLLLNSSVTEVQRPAYFVPETKRLADLVEEMRTRRTQIALVVDEFGGISGLVTFRRVVEELVGRVEEPDEPESYQSLDERTVIVDGLIHIEELAERLHIHLPPGDGQYETVAGFILAELGHIPQEGEQVVHEQYRITVQKMHGPRIDEVMIQTEQPATQEQGS
jgi:putative hemolysin